MTGDDASKDPENWTDLTLEAARCRIFDISLASRPELFDSRRQPTPLPILPRNSQEIHLLATNAKIVCKHKFWI